MTHRTGIQASLADSFAALAARPDAPARVLVVDDSDDARHFLVQALRTVGHAVDEAGAGEKGLALARANKPDLAVVDINLPDINGVEVCERIKADAGLSDVFVALISSDLRTPDDRAVALEKGADAFLVRPIGPRELLARVEAMLRLQRANKRLRRQIEFHERLLEEANVWIDVIDTEGKPVFWNKQAEVVSGFKKEEILGSMVKWERMYPDAAYRAELLDYCRRLMAEGRTVRDVETRVATAWGDERVMSWSSNLLRDDDDEVLGAMFIGLDVTDRIAAEEALRRSERQLTIQNQIAHVFLTSDEQDVYSDTLDIVLKCLDSPFGYFGHVDDEGDLVCPAVAGEVWGDRRDEDGVMVFRRSDWRGLWGRSLESGRTLFRNEGLTADDGGAPLFALLAAPILIQGKAIGQFVAANKPGGYDDGDAQTIENIATQAAPILKATLDRRRHETMLRRLEAQLRQAHKMEAIGTLAGGVAHDFNNILQAIVGNLKIVEENVADDADTLELVGDIERSARRAASLTSQMLAFSRQQVLRPRTIDLNETIGHLLKMIGRTIGAHIELEFTPSTEPVEVHADPGQIEQTLMNLCVNARDAMAEGGRLEIVTENFIADERFCEKSGWAKPGRYALVTVADTGHGMDAETREQVFEPFFTTKEVGKGTGLGLSMAYGIVTQHNGMIDVQSRKGVGTTFRIYLPQSDGETEEGEAPAESAAQTGGAETVLIAEDDETVLRLTRRLFERAGYRVLAAKNGEEALGAIAECRDEIDLAVLDLVMPKQSGRSLYEALCDGKPQARVIFVSGYSADLPHAEFIRDNNLSFLQKPYDPARLLQVAREMLDV